MTTTIKIALPLPIRVIGPLGLAIDALWPGATARTDGPAGFMTIDVDPEAFDEEFYEELQDRG